MEQPTQYTDAVSSYLAAVIKLEPEESFPVELDAVNAYLDGINVLLHRVNLKSGCSKGAAQVLLGTCYGDAWHLDILDLTSLDPEGVEAALAVMRGRLTLGITPRQALFDGDAVYERLMDEYDHLRVGKRS